MPRSWIVCWFFVALSFSVRGAEPPAAVTVQLVRPDEQCGQVLDLFRGARAPHPAAALAAWRRASGKNLSKSAEALIAFFNPAMAPELKTLDGAVFRLRLEPDDARVRWSATVPRDDGTFAALATALVLTDGASDPPLGAVPVDRLGPLGAPLMARTREGLVLAGGRDELEAALARSPDQKPPTAAPGVLFRFDPAALDMTGPVAQRRATEALRALGCREAQGRAAVEDDAFAVEVTAQLGSTLNATGLDARWLDWVPADSTLAAVAFTVDPRPEAWDRVFTLADRVERADPARAGVAPLRTRLNLLALGAKVQPEVDLWPALQGVTACALTETGEITGALLALHATDDAAARRLDETVLPRLLASRTQPAPDTKPAPEGRTLGRVGGRPLRAARRGATVVLGWGDAALAKGLGAYDHSEQSAGRMVRAAWGQTPPPRAGAFWPARSRGVAGTVLAADDAPPVVWWGRNEDRTTRDFLRWGDLRGLVRRFLDRLPLDPPPDR